MSSEKRLFSFDQNIRHEGFKIIAGIDEAGRGPWAGPVVAAIVIMPEHVYIPEVNDSKKLTPSKRGILYNYIISSCLEYATGMVNHKTIDSINILEATHEAIKRALEKLSLPVDLFLVDGCRKVSSISYPQRCISGGDGLSFSIACASIVAKVTRDRIMVKLDAEYPGWGFAKHKGYGTKEHVKALDSLGISPIHRKSFRPIKRILEHVFVS